MYVGCSVLSLIFPPASLTIWPIHLWSAPQCQAKPAPSNPPGPSPATTDLGSHISYFKWRILIKTIWHRRRKGNLLSTVANPINFCTWCKKCPSCGKTGSRRKHQTYLRRKNRLISWLELVMAADWDYTAYWCWFNSLCFVDLLAKPITFVIDYSENLHNSYRRGSCAKRPTIPVDWTFDGRRFDVFASWLKRADELHSITVCSSLPRYRNIGGPADHLTPAPRRT